MSAVGQPTTATPKPDATRPSIAAEAQRAQFVTAADQELTGHRWHPSAGLERHEYVGRRRILFGLEHDAHSGLLEAWQLPAFPPGHPARTAAVRRVRLAGRVAEPPGDTTG